MNLVDALRSVATIELRIIAFGKVGLTALRKVFGSARAGRHLGWPVSVVGYLILPFYLRRYDLVYFAGGPFHAVLPLLFSKLAGYPVVVYCVHGVIRQERRIHSHEESRAPAWKEWIEGFVVKHSESLICPSPRCVGMLTEAWRVEKSKTFVVPFGVRDGFGYRGERRPNSRVPSKIITVSKIHECKGLTFLLRALKELSEDAFELTIISGGGSNAYRRHLEEIIANSDGKLEGRVKFLGPLDAEDLKEQLASGSLYVQPSRNETFCMAALEAMSVGLPVVVTRSTGMSYLLREGENGFVVDFGDVSALANRIKTLLEDAALRERMGRANIARAREINWDASAAALVEHFRQLLRPPGLDAKHACKELRPKERKASSVE